MKLIEMDFISTSLAPAFRTRTVIAGDYINKELFFTSGISFGLEKKSNNPPAGEAADNLDAGAGAAGEEGTVGVDFVAVANDSPKVPVFKSVSLNIASSLVKKLFMLSLSPSEVNALDTESEIVSESTT